MRFSFILIDYIKKKLKKEINYQWSSSFQSIMDSFNNILTIKGKYLKILFLNYFKQGTYLRPGT